MGRQLSLELAMRLFGFGTRFLVLRVKKVLSREAFSSLLGLILGDTSPAGGDVLVKFAVRFIMLITFQAYQSFLYNSGACSQSACFYYIYSIFVVQIHIVLFVC